MTEEFEFLANDADRIVYIRPVDKTTLPDDVQAQLADQAQIYAVHGADGERLALVADRALAFTLARQNDFAPVSVH